MSNTNRQSRLDTLKIREAEGTLTEKERAELNAIFAETDLVIHYKAKHFQRPTRVRTHHNIPARSRINREFVSTISSLQSQKRLYLTTQFLPS